MVDDILVTRPSTKPEIIVDTLEDEEEVIEDNVHEIEEDEESPKRWPTVLYSHGVYSKTPQCDCNTMLETDGSSHFCVLPFNM